MKQSKQLSLLAYVERRNGVPLGASGSLQNMLTRSFGAGNFARFWQYWNPIWGYGLGRYVYAPLNRFFPRVVALILTFTVSGLIHDMVIMFLRREPAFIFTPWFAMMSLIVIIGQYFRLDYSGQPFLVRMVINLSQIVSCLMLTLGLQQVI